MGYVLGRWCLFLLACCGLGCGRFYSPAALDPSVYTPERVVAAVNRNYSQLRNLEGEIHFAVDAGFVGFLTQVIITEVVVKMPDTVAMRVAGPLGISLGSALVSSDGYVVRDYITGQTFSGETDSLDLGAMLPAGEGFDFLVEALTGLVSIPAEDLVLIRDYSVRDGAYYLEIAKDGWTYAYWIDPKRFIVRKVSIRDPADVVELEREYERFEVSSGVTLPRVIRISRPAEGESLTIFYERRTVNAERVKWVVPAGGGIN